MPACSGMKKSALKPLDVDANGEKSASDAGTEANWLKSAKSVAGAGDAGVVWLLVVLPKLEKSPKATLVCWFAVGGGR